MKKNNLNEDEVDFFELLEKIFKEKLIILTVTFFSFLISFLYIYQNKTNEDKFIVSIDISEISKLNTIKFIIVDQFVQESLLLDINDFKKSGQSSSILSINSAYFLNNFIEELLKKNILKDVFFEKIQKNATKNYDVSIVNKTSWAMANNIQLQAKKTLAKTSQNKRNYNLSFKVKDKNEGKLLIEKMLFRINKKIIFNTKIILNKILESNEAKLNLKKQHIESKIKDLLELNSTEILKNIQFIKKHIKISKELNIVKNDFDKTYKSINPLLTKKLYENPMLDLTFFYLGTKQLTQYLKIYKDKLNTKDYLNEGEIFKLTQELNTLKQNVLNNVLRDAINNSPLVSNDFKVVYYNINNLKFTPLPSGTKFVVISTFLGFILSVIFILLKISYVNYKRQKNH